MYSDVIQRQTAVTGHLRTKQLMLFVFAGLNHRGMRLLLIQEIRHECLLFSVKLNLIPIDFSKVLHSVSYVFVFQVFCGWHILRNVAMEFSYQMISLSNSALLNLLSFSTSAQLHFISLSSSAKLHLISFSTTAQFHLVSLSNSAQLVLSI